MSDNERTVNDKVTAAVSVAARTPPFWRDKPALWFAQFELITGPQKLGDETKCHLVVSHLEKQDIEQISDIIRNPPATDKYKALKDRLIEVYEESERSRLQRLVQGTDPGDLTPSQLLRRMRDLAGGSNTSDSFIRACWHAKLPANVRAILSVARGVDIDTQATIADEIIANSVPTGGVAAIQPRDSSDSATEMARMFQKLDARLSKLESESSSRGPRHWRRSRSRSRSRSRTPGQSNSGLCYYHERYGSNAKKCRPPCSKSKNQSN